MVQRQFYVRTIPLTITFLLGMLFLVEYFLTVPGAEPAATELRAWATLIFGFSVCYGTLSLVRGHLTQAVRKKTDSYSKFCSLWLVFVFFVFLIPGWVLKGGASNADYTSLYNNIYGVGSTAFFSLHGFWVTMALFKSFRPRNVEAALLFGTAIVTLIGIAPWGELAWPPIRLVEQWVEAVLLTQGLRGITIGAGAGIIVTAIRTLIGRETGYFGGK